MSPDMNPIEGIIGLSRTKSERTYPKVTKHSGISDCVVQELQQYSQRRQRRLIHGMKRRVQELYMMRGGYTRYLSYYE
jgi:hypothetical protein